MSAILKSKKEFQDICLKAVKCRDCFHAKGLNLGKPWFDMAQPRWVGENYWKARFKILVLMINPGDGGDKPNDKKMKIALKKFKLTGNKAYLEAAFRIQKEESPNWGPAGGNFEPFYMGMGLNLDQIAFANVAWCAGERNKHPSKMLTNCFERHTKSLINTLNPHVVVLSGSCIPQKIKNDLSDYHVIHTFHFAHRKSDEIENQEQKKVKRFIKEVKQICGVS